MPRQRIITVNELEKLCRLHVTQAEAAAYFGVSVRAVEAALQKPELREAWEQGRANGLLSLKRAQMTKALSGNPTMLIWLGKQLLGQKDQVINTHDGSVEIRDDTHRAQLESKLASLLTRRSGANTPGDQSLQ